MGRIGKRMVLMSATDSGPSFPTAQIVESDVEMSAPAFIKSIGIMRRMIALLVLPTSVPTSSQINGTKHSISLTIEHQVDPQFFQP